MCKFTAVQKDMKLHTLRLIDVADAKGQPFKEAVPGRGGTPVAAP